MAHHRRLVRVSYDQLYLFFVRELGAREYSHPNWDSENLDGYWETCVDTNCGLFLYRPPLYRERVYRRAPLNSVTFAHTGGECIHYSFLVLDGHWSELSPVVMTDPSSVNIIVGEDLTAFLRLGIRTGYFALPYHLPAEDGQFEDASAVAPLEANAFAEWLVPEEITVLQRLADQFGWEPHKNVAEYLADLQHRYQPLIQHPPDQRPDESMEEVALARFRPGDAVIWEKQAGRGAVPVKATVLAVTTRRVTIAAEDPEQTGGGVVTRHVSALSLRLQQRGPMDSQRLPPNIPRCP